jgi:hypothetical protein
MRLLRCANQKNRERTPVSTAEKNETWTDVKRKTKHFFKTNPIGYGVFEQRLFLQLEDPTELCRLDE